MKVVRLNKLFLFLLCQISVIGMAQISPAGISSATHAAWSGIGVKTSFGKTKNWESFSYVSHGFIYNEISNKKNDITGFSILNSELHYQFKKHWKFSNAISYRSRNDYNVTDTFDNSNSTFLKELRYYTRISWSTKLSKSQIGITIREDFRKFYTFDFVPINHSFQFRTRLKVNWIYPLDKDLRHKLILSGESLFSIKKTSSSNPNWDKMKYNDTRLSLFYTYSLSNNWLQLQLGYMHNIIGVIKAHHVGHIAVNLVFNILNKKTE